MSSTSRAPKGASSSGDASAARSKARPRRASAASTAETRRGSREAVEKRRAARHFNELLLGGSTARSRLDGRTEKRRKRMLDELKEGQLRASGRQLKPIDVLLRVHELLELGEAVASLRKVCKPARPVPTTDEVVVGVRRLHDAYGFRPEVYAFVGIAPDAVERAGIVKPTRPGVRPSRRVGESAGKAA